MPSRKALNRYPKEYAHLFHLAYQRGLVKVETPSPGAAQALRKDLYNYRVALWEDTVRPPIETDQQLMQIAEDLTFKIRQSSVFITIKESVYTTLVQQAIEELQDEST